MAAEFGDDAVILPEGDEDVVREPERDHHDGAVGCDTHRPMRTERRTARVSRDRWRPRHRHHRVGEAGAEHPRT